MVYYLIVFFFFLMVSSTRGHSTTSHKLQMQGTHTLWLFLARWVTFMNYFFENILIHISLVLLSLYATHLNYGLSV